MGVTLDPTLGSRLVGRANNDGEFRLAARYWDGVLQLGIGADALAFKLSAGTLLAAPPGSRFETAPARIAIEATADVWEKILQLVPPPMFNDIAPAMAAGLTVSGDQETYWQYYPAIRRLVDLLREEVNRDATL